MTDPLIVLLDDTAAGTITRLTSGRLRFDYREAYRVTPGATPLSVSMPTAIATHPDGVITPWLWGLLPDNELVLARWAREFHVSASSPFSLLGTPVGHDCPGSVRLASAEDADDLLKRRGRVDWLTEDEVATRLRELKTDATAWLGRGTTGQFSLAGSQAKTALLYEDGKWGVPRGSLATTHILKPAVAGLDDHDLNEHLCLDAARRVGLVVSRTRVSRFGDESAIVVERYDRRRERGRIIRIHQEDVCQALSLPPSAKYQNEGGPGAKTVVALFRSVMPAEAADDATSRFLDALIWNWVIGGTDAHAKNYSLLLASDEVRLAPLYDIASILPYGKHEKKLRFAMKLGSDYQVDPRRNPWPKVAAELGIDADATIARVRALTDGAPAAFADAAQVSEVVALERPIAAHLVDLVAERAARCKQLLD